ncbi:hypothetical protein OPIT5_11065 [Opitutaceae bacterium TAV5]|nr:hypothetical protein OPIT5_11065 [Opitutaceae bacterium TAV5]
MAFSLVDWNALAPGRATREAWMEWAASSAQDIPAPDVAGEGGPPLPKTPHIPMMAARRMSPGTRLAVEAALALMETRAAIPGAPPVDALVFSSRHGELERTLQIIRNLADGSEISPTDFAMSVHNTAAGLLTITAGAALPATSVAAGIDSFQQALFEVAAFFEAGMQSVLLLDFEGRLPEFYRAQPGDTSGTLPPAPGFEACAVALLLRPGNDCRVTSLPAANPAPDAAGAASPWPQSVRFLRHYLARRNRFTLGGDHRDWLWNCVAS